MKHVLIIEIASGQYLLASHLICYTTWDRPVTIKTYGRPASARRAWEAFKRKFECSIRLKPAHGYVVQHDDLEAVLTGRIPLPTPLT